MSNNIYLVERPIDFRFSEAEALDANYDFSRRACCPECGSFVSCAYWVPPRNIVLTRRKMPDILYIIGDLSTFALSERALSAFQRAGLTGITDYAEFDSARFHRKGKKEIEIPKYYHIELARSRITINHDASEIVYGDLPWSDERKYCPLCRRVPGSFNFTRKLSFHMDAYEGYDIFHCYEFGDQTFVSQKFVDLCKKENLTNLYAVPPERYGALSAAYFLDGDKSALKKNWRREDGV